MFKGSENPAGSRASPPLLTGGTWTPTAERRGGGRSLRQEHGGIRSERRHKGPANGTPPPPPCAHSV